MMHGQKNIKLYEVW